MAKKKQFAGKQTKLAALPLTRALAEKTGTGDVWEELQTSGATGSRQLLLSMERTGEESGPLAAVYLQVFQELAGLHADLGAASRAAASPPEPLAPGATPSAGSLIQALSQAREGLLDLRRFLSVNSK
jgi:hypothetical protein